ncbi:MAG TPA: transcriptional repressor [Puia sp.]|nr:transcriptional repressor [Puia sp.]
MAQDSISILKKYQINITRPRVLILDAFMHAHRSLDQQYFLQKAEYGFNRTTIFRALKTLTEKKIIYRVSADGSSKYIYLQDVVNHSRMSEHSSFVCTGCGKAILIDTIEVPKLKIPKGFTKQDMEIIIRGICPTCNL